MVKTWKVTFEVNMDASHQVAVTVLAHTYKNAKTIAMKHLEKEGYFFVKFVSCKEIIKG